MLGTSNSKGSGVLEELSELTYHLEGTMNKLYQCTLFQRAHSQCLGSIPDHIYSALIRIDERDPTLLLTAEESEWIVKSQKRGKILERETQMIYRSMLEYCFIHRRCSASFKRIVTSVLHFDLQTNAELCQRIFHLFALCVRSSFLAARVARNPDARLACLIHTLLPGSVQRSNDIVNHELFGKKVGIPEDPHSEDDHDEEEESSLLECLSPKREPVKPPPTMSSAVSSGNVFINPAMNRTRIAPNKKRSGYSAFKARMGQVSGSEASMKSVLSVISSVGGMDPDSLGLTMTGTGSTDNWETMMQHTKNTLIEMANDVFEHIHRGSFLMRIEPMFHALKSVLIKHQSSYQQWYPSGADAGGDHTQYLQSLLKQELPLLQKNAHFDGVDSLINPPSNARLLQITQLGFLTDRIVQEEWYARFPQLIPSLDQWLFAICMVFPSHCLNDQPLSSLIQSYCAHHNHALIHRDYIVSIITQMESSLRTIINFDSTSNPELSSSLDRFKQIKSLTNINDSKMKKKQRDNNQIRMHQYLKQSMNTLLSILDEFPGVIAVKMDVIHSLLCTIRSQLLNVIFMERSDPNTKILSMESFCDDCASLLDSFIRVCNRINRHSSLIYKYYAEIIVDLHLPLLESSLRKCIEESTMDGSCVVIVERVLSQLIPQLKQLHPKGIPSDDWSDLIHQLKHEIIQIQFELTTTSARSESAKRQNQELLKQMSMLHRDSLYACNLQTNVLFDHSVNLTSQLWWFMDQIKPLLHQSPKHWALSLAVCHHSMLEIHECFSQECTLIAQMALRYADYYLSYAGKQVCGCLESLIQHYQKLSEQTSAETLGIYLEKSVRSQKISKDVVKSSLSSSSSSAAGSERCAKLSAPTTAGNESHFFKNQSQTQSQSILDITVRLTHLLNGYEQGTNLYLSMFQEYSDSDDASNPDDCVEHGSSMKQDSIDIHNQRLFLSGHLRQSIHDFIRHRIFGDWKQQRPSSLERELNAVFMALDRINSLCGDLGITEMMQDLIFQQCYDHTIIDRPVRLLLNKQEPSSLDQCDGSTMMTTKKPKKKWLTQVVEFYSSLIEFTYPFVSLPRSGSIDDINSRFNVQSSHIRAVYSTIDDNWHSTQKSPIMVQDYCSVSEMQSLCQVIGAHGLRAIDTELVTQLRDSLANLIAFVKDSPLKLEELVDYAEGKISQISQDISTDRLLAVLTHHGIRIGSIIVIRRNLRKALWNVTSQRASFEHHCMNQLQTAMLDQHRNRREWDHFCSRAGMSDERTQLRDELWQHFSDVLFDYSGRLSNDDEPPRNVICDLAVAMGAVFLQSHLWHRVYFNPRLGNLSNNAFVLADCVDCLIHVFDSDRLSRVTRKKHFLFAVCKSIMTLVENHPSHSHTSNLILFADYFCRVCDDLFPADLYTLGVGDLVRSEYIRVFSNFDKQFVCHQGEIVVTQDPTTEQTQRMHSSSLVVTDLE